MLNPSGPDSSLSAANPSTLRNCVPTLDLELVPVSFHEVKLTNLIQLRVISVLFIKAAPAAGAPAAGGAAPAEEKKEEKKEEPEEESDDDMGFGLFD